MLIDARSVEDNKQYSCDVCVVGSGPAGIALVDRLRTSGLHVILLESGGFNLELSTQNLYRGQLDGHPYFRLDACRWRLFGGTSARWGGWCRPLEAYDYDKRDWLPLSGWPIQARDLLPFHEDAAKLFELPNARFDMGSWQQRLPKQMPLQGSAFESIVFQHSPETDFGLTYKDRIVAADNITTFIHANLIDIRLAAGTQRVESLSVGALNGRRFTVRPKFTVLAAGGIENARLLLAANKDRANGLGNENDMVGRCFMEHLHVPVGHILTNGKPNWDQNYFAKAAFSDVILRGVLTPTAKAMAENQYLTTSIAIEKAAFSFGTPYVGWPPPITFGPVKFYRAHKRGALGPAVEYCKHTTERVESVLRRIATKRISTAAKKRAGNAGPHDEIYSVYFRAEQAPNPSNRITLTDDKDALGVPRLKLTWEVKPIDRAGVDGWLATLDQTLQQRNMGRIIYPQGDWVDQVIGGPHHMGATRMSADPKDGVVDGDCKVHTVDNLYVAGSSVFTTSGYVNPTYSLVLLALRLADHLQAKFR